MARHALPVVLQQPHGQQSTYGPYQHPGPVSRPAKVHTWPQAAQAVRSQGFAHRQHHPAQMQRRLFTPDQQSSQSHGTMHTVWQDQSPLVHLRQQQVVTCRPLQPQPSQTRPAQLASMPHDFPMHLQNNAGVASNKQQLDMAHRLSQAHAVLTSQPAIAFAM